MSIKLIFLNIKKYIILVQSNPDIPVYTISTAAKLLDISVHTLRMYEREGLIIPHKEGSKNRLYSQNDLARLDCIRNAIKVKKYTIPSIKAMFSFLPCWEIIKCSESDRGNCEYYRVGSAPCWTYKHQNNGCFEKKCRNCNVYNDYTDCEKIKESIKELLRSK